MGETVVGINEPTVTAWLVSNVGATAPITYELVAGGRSNLTYRVTDASGTRFALRRPPLSHVLPTAHDMVREHTIISAVQPQGIPVATPLGLCTDETVNERPFYVMEFVDGHILRDRRQTEAAFDEPARREIGTSLATTLAKLHDVDLDVAGLSGLARHEGYIERQLKRWRGQYEQMAVEGVDYGGIIEDVGDHLAATIPTQQRVTVVHGDYRLDNTVLDDAGRVRAILDWEICTLGDPLADIGLLLVYWNEPADDGASLLGVSPTMAKGMLSRAELLATYDANSTLDLSPISFYQAFGYWKLACICQGVFARYLGGAAGGDQGSVSEYPTMIKSLATQAQAILEER
jgi:aminoglycoside phosphotransferase (APT) family kinase protein